MRNRLTNDVVGALVFFLACGISATASAQARTIRVVTYNIRCATASGDPATPSPGLITPSSGGSVTNGGVLEGIGEEILAGNYQPLDILALQETTSNTTTVLPIVNGLNTFYSVHNIPAGYAMSPYQATSGGGGSGGGGVAIANALVYNTNTLQLLASVPVDPPGGIGDLGSISGMYREVMRYQFAPAGVPTNSTSTFFVYVSHYKSGGGTSNEAARAAEAGIIRTNSAALPADSRILYVGDYNTLNSSQPAYRILVAPGVNQAFDPINPSGASGIEWGGPTNEVLTFDSYVLSSRLDYQMMTSNVLYGVGTGLALVPGTYHVFGNNGSSPFVTSVSNTALDNLNTNGVGITAAQLRQYLYWATDHLPVVADYTLSGVAVTLPASATEGDGVLVGQSSVGVSTAPLADLTVNLTSSDMTELTVPASVIIPAGLTNVTFDVTIVDDTDLDGSQSATVTATASGYGSRQATMTVYDNETAMLALQVPTTVAEGSAPVGATLFASAPPSTNVTVSLSSSDPTEATVPASVILPAGQTSGVFNVTIINDALIDGSQPVTITAHFQNWTDGVASLTVLDNENTNLVVTMPSVVREGQGVVTNAGTVRISGTWPAALTVNLASSDTTELTVPASVTIPAGQTNVTFNVTVIDDAETDGTQPVTVTASATGFADGSAGTTVLDNDLHHFAWNVISSPQSAGTPFSVTITAQDINSAIISNYPGPASLSGLGDSGPVALTPTTSGAFGIGLWTGNLTITTLDTNVRLVASDGAGHSGTSTPFNVVIGPLHHFAWSTVASPQPVGIPFAVTITAQDVANNTVVSFTNSVALSGQTWTNVVLLADEVEGGTNGWTHSGTIDLWHISTNRYASPTRAWYCGNDTARVYSNMMNCSLISPAVVLGAGAKLSFQHWYFTETGYDFGYVELSTNNWATASTLATFHGAGTAWRGQTNDLSAYAGQPAQIRFRFSTDGSTAYEGWYIDDIVINASNQTAIAITPTNSGNFVSGFWTGAVTVLEVATNMVLVAADGSSHSGTSTVFSVVVPPFTQWQLSYFGCTNCPQAAATSDPDGDGQDNLTEFLTGMDPTNSASAWRIQASPTNGLSPLSVSFTNNSTGSSITNQVWSFGDGGVGSGTNPGHTYTNADTFSVGLTLFNLNGTTTLVASNLITVFPGATVEVAALALLDRWGDLMPASGVAVLVVDTGTNGFVDPQPPFPLSVGAAWGTDDRVVGLWNLNSCGDGCLWDQTAVGYTNGITSGQILRLYWFPSLTLASNTVGWTYYGKYTDTNSPPLDGSAPWELPPVESSATLIFFTQSEGGSNPNDAGRATWSTFLDSDADDIPDYWMLQYFGHATGQASDNSRAQDDASGTGQNNLFKYTAGLDPTNAASVFALRLESVPGQPNQKVLTWKPLAVDRTYAPEFSTNLTLGWSPLTVYDGPVTNGNQVTITDQNAVESNKFYRIKISYP